MRKNDMDASKNTGMEKRPSNPNEYIYNLCNRFYALVDHLETMEKKHQVTMDFASCLHKLSLGDVIDIDDGLYDNYVITRMYGTFSCTGSSDGSSAVETCFHKAEGIPVLSNSPDADGTVSAPIIDGLLRVVVPPSGVISSVKNSNGGDGSPSSGVKSFVKNSNDGNGSTSAQLDFLEAKVSANADPSKMNRVKVKYIFDNSQNETETPWIPVLAPFAGAGGHGGITMTLEVGERVLVLLQNKTVKYVVGSLHTKDNEPDLGYKDNVPATYKVGRKIRTIASGNGHAITFKDYSDNNILFSKIPIVNSFFSYYRLNDKKTCMSKTGFGKIKGGGIVLSDGSCLCTLSLDADKQAININSDFGTVGISAFTGITVNAPNGDITIKGKNVSIEAGNNLSLKAGTNIRPAPNGQSILSSVTSSIGLGAATALVGMGTSYLSTQYGVDLSNVLDVSYLRNIYEIFMRPVEGTLSIQSNRNVLMTAGTGKVTLPTSLLAKGNYTKQNDQSKKNFTIRIQNALNEVDSYCKALKEENDNLKDRYDNIVEFYQKTGDNKPDNGEGDKLLKTSLADLHNEEFCHIDELYKNGLDLDQPSHNDQTLFNQIQKRAISFKRDARKYRADLCGLTKLQGILDPYLTIGTVGSDMLSEDTISDESNNWTVVSKLKSKYEYELGIRRLKRLVVVKMLQSNEQILVTGGENANYAGTNLRIIVNKKTVLPHYVNPDNDTYRWNDLCGALVWKDDEKGNLEKLNDKLEKYGNLHGPVPGSILGGITDALGAGSYDKASGKWKPLPSWKKFLNIDGEGGPRGYEDMSTSKGSILLSNTSGASLSLNDTKGWISHLNITDTNSLGQMIKDLNLA